MLQTKRPNIKNHIAIYYDTHINEKILKEDVCVNELMLLNNDYKFAINFTYAIYTDMHSMKDNMFIPIFHSFYLNSDPKIVILRGSNVDDILELYPYHQFVIYKTNDTDTGRYTELSDRFPDHDIKLINSLKDLI